MITDTRTISSPDTAILLWQHLGPLRVWPAFLADNIRGKQDVNGYTLLPCARTMHGRDKSPAYAVEQITQFIRDVKASTPGAGAGKITVTTLAIDSLLPWQYNRFDRTGKPVRRKCSVYAGAGRGAGAVGHTCFQ